MIDLFVEYFFGKFVKTQVYHFFLATSTYKRTPCQMISFFDYFFSFFDFFENMVRMAVVAIQ